MEVLNREGDKRRRSYFGSSTRILTEECLRGRFIWFSTNQSNINNFKIANYALQTQAQGGSEDETLQKVRLVEEMATATGIEMVVLYYLIANVGKPLRG